MDTLKDQVLSKLGIKAYYQEQISGKIVKGNNDWFNCRCPLPGHDDQHPSFGFNRTTGAFKCFACGKSGDLVIFEQLLHGGTYREALQRLAERIGLTLPVPNGDGNSLEDRVERYHRLLLDNLDNSLTTAIEMGISRTTIVKHKLGYMPQYGDHEARLIFPIFDEYGEVLTLKKYSRQVPHKIKSKFEKGGQVSLYGIHQLNGNLEVPVVICAGEKDKCVGESHLGDRYLFVTFTGGEGSLPKGELWDKTVAALQDRDLTICYDADEPGKKGAEKLAKALTGVGRRLAVVEWPEVFAKEFPKGDTTDCVMLWQQGGAKVMADILEQARPVDGANLPTLPAVTTRARQAGNIVEQDGVYLKINDKNTQPISNFIINPLERLWIDGKEAVKVELHHPTKGNYPAMLERDSWRSRPNFLRQINTIDLSFTGSDNDLQHIQEIVASYDVPVHNATRILGYAAVSDQKLFVLPDQIISTRPDHQLLYAPEVGQHPLAPMFRPKATDDTAFLAPLFQYLPGLHEPLPLAVLLGWLFATPFKPQLMKLAGHFPLVNIYGTKGSGKTSLATLLWQMFGFGGEIFSCTQSQFTWLSVVSATNAYPIFFDEFKPWDMPAADVQRVQRLARRIYAGEIEAKGRPNQTLTQYRLQAPIGILGEVGFREPALLERVLPVPLSFQRLSQQHRESYRQLRQLPLRGFLPLYLPWVLSWDTASHWQQAVAKVNALGHDCADRVRDNLAVVLFGLQALQTFAATHNATIPDWDEAAIVKLCLTELCGEISGGRLAVDTLLEKLAYLAESSVLVRDRDYKVEGHCVWLRLEPCLDKFKEWAKRVAFDGEILDAKAYRQMLQERLPLYVDHIGKQVKLNGINCRCVVVDKDRALQSNLPLDGFR